MTLRALAMPAGVPGRMWLASMPGRYESWPAFLEQASAARLTLVICLTPRHEIQSCSPAYAEAVAGGKLPFRWLNLTMRDFGLATDAVAFNEGIQGIADAVSGGEHVLLHCAAGIGRTGTAACCVLRRLGMARNEAITSVRAAGSNPQSALQSGLIDRF